MPSSNCTILARFFTRRQVDKSQKNAQNQRQISARSREWQLRSVNYQRRDLRESMRHRHPGNIWHAKYLELSVIHNPAVWIRSNWKIHRWCPSANERARYRAAGGSGRTFNFFKVINVSHLQTTCIHFDLRIYRSGRLHEDVEGARVFL